MATLLDYSPILKIMPYRSVEKEKACVCVLIMESIEN